MENKERFIRAMARFQNYRSRKETKNKLLEKAFGSDTVIFDFDGVDELLDSVIDLACLIFTNLSEEEITENIEWYVYEAVDMDEPLVENNGKNYIVNSTEVLFEMLKDFNNVSSD